MKMITPSLRFWLGLLFCLLSSLSGCRASVPFARSSSHVVATGVVPEDWYLAPEDGVALNPGSPEKLAATTDRFLEAQSAALETLRNGSAEPIRSNGHPKDGTPWHLALVTTEFAVTAQGVFAALLGQGTASVKATWAKSGGLPRARAQIASPVPQVSAVSMTGEESSRQLTARLEPTIRAALSTGLIKNESFLRKNVLSAAEDFRAMADRLSSLSLSSRYRPSTFRVDVGVDTNGQIVPLVGIGMAVSFRFDWNRATGDEKRVSDPSASAPTSNSAVTRNLEKFVRALALDLDDLESDSAVLRGYDFDLSSVRFGVAISAGYDFGIAKSSSEVEGSLEFEHLEENPALATTRSLPVEPDDHATDPDDDTINLIDSTSQTGHRDFAVAEGIPFTVTSMTSLKANPPRDTVVYRVKRTKFRKGLRKAMRLASFFARRANTARLGVWKVQEISTSFEMSLSGDLGLSTLGGSGEVELEFENKRIPPTTLSRMATALVLPRLQSPLRTLPQMMKHLGDRVSGADSAFQQACLAAPDSGNDPDWDLDAFYLNIAPSASFGLSGVLELEISPDLTLIWEKVGAENWVEE